MCTASILIKFERDIHPYDIHSVRHSDVSILFMNKATVQGEIRGQHGIEWLIIDSGCQTNRNDIEYHMLALWTKSL